MDTIIVPLDGSSLSERALPVGVQFARMLHAPLELVHVLVEPPLLEAAYPTTIPDEAAAKAYLERVSDALPGDVPWRTLVLHGDPAQQIVGRAERVPASVLVLSTHGRGGLGRVLFGSVADAVMRAACRPVVLVRDNDAERTHMPRRILVPLDGSAFSEEALPLAARIAGKRHAALQLLRVIPAFWGPPYSAVELVATSLTPELIADIADGAQGEAEAYLRACAQRLRDADITVDHQTRIGRPADEIARAIDELHADLVVMTTHGYGGLRRLAIGSVVNETLHRTTTPLLIIPPAAIAAQRAAATRAAADAPGAAVFERETRLDRQATASDIPRPPRDDPRFSDRSAVPGHADVPIGGTTGGRARSGGGAGSVRSEPRRPRTRKSTSKK